MFTSSIFGSAAVSAVILLLGIVSSSLRKSYFRSLCKVKMAAPARQAVKQAVDKGSMMYRFRKWCYYRSYFPELGLRKDDITMGGPVMGPVIQEALRRIPKSELDARNFRILRANQLSMMKQILPKDQWTNFEEDTPYLQPYIDEVLREEEERKEWDSK